jgi:tetratricopeptide (TPR) repeat protein
MQIRIVNPALPIFFGSLLLFFSARNSFSQNKEELENKKIAASDSLFNQTQRACLDATASQKPETWYNRARALSSIMDDPTLAARHSQADIPSETANALLLLRALDASQQYRHYTEPGLAGICLDLGNSGIHSIENARLYDSPEDARIACELLEKAMECYKLTGESKSVVDNEWKKHGLDYNWLRFFSGVAYRKAGDKTRASQIYDGLYQEKWPKAAFFLEASNLADSLGLLADAVEILKNGQKQIPGSIDMGCALVTLYLKQDMMNESKAELRKLDLNQQSKYHPEYAYAQGAYFEKKGDVSKADACYQIPYKADPNEVSGIRRYASFLMRRAKSPESSGRGELVAKALQMLRHARELSPENTVIEREIQDILKQFPEAGKS